MAQRKSFVGSSNARSHSDLYLSQFGIEIVLQSCFPQPSLPRCFLLLHLIHWGSAPSLHPPMKLPLTQTFGTLLELVFSVNSLLKNAGKIQIRARGKRSGQKWLNYDEILKVKHQLSRINYNHWPQWATTNWRRWGALGESPSIASKCLGIMPIVTPQTANLQLQILHGTASAF